MPCACRNKRKSAGSTSYVHTAPSGKQTAYSTKIDAEAAKMRSGGTVTKQ